MLIALQMEQNNFLGCPNAKFKCFYKLYEFLLSHLTLYNSQLNSKNLGDGGPVDGLDDSSDEYDPNFNLPGAKRNDIPTCTTEEKLLTVLGGAYLYEKSWTITECDGTEIASGGAPYAQCINLGENYIINLADDQVDGWDGTEMNIYLSARNWLFSSS